MDKVTIYKSSEFGFINKVEARLVSHGRRPYAQYNSAVEVVAKLKRKRKNSRFIVGYNPWVVIVEGWNNPDIDKISWEEGVCETTGIRYRKSKTTAFDPSLKKAGDKFLDDLIDNGTVKVVADYRYVNTHLEV